MEHPVFLEIFKEMPQGAPGDDRSSEKAFSYLKDLPEKPDILDVGCGTGRHTLLLSRLTKGRITALDLLEQNIKILNNKIETDKLGNRIRAVRGDMNRMPFKREQFNLIWAEGSIYAIGFGKGLQKWKKFIRADGYLVASEVVWVRDEPPFDLKAFWDSEYPGMLTHKEALNIAKKEGYKITGSFPVSPEGWKNYYGPLEKRINEMRDTCKNDEEAYSILESIDREIMIYKNYKEYFEYMIYILQKKEDLYIRSMCGIRTKIE